MNAPIVEERRAAYARVESALFGVLPGVGSDPEIPWDREKAKGHKSRDRRFISTGNVKLDRIVANAGVRIRYGSELPGNVVLGTMERGEIVPNDPEVTWIEFPVRSSFHSAASYLRTVAHELVHWSHVEGVSPRPMTGRNEIESIFGMVPAGYAEEELVAEIGAALLLEAVGEDPDIRERASYINNWAEAIPEHSRRGALREAAKTAEAAVEALLRFAEI